MLSADDIAAMRATVSASLPDTCSLVTAGRTSDGAGGWTDTSTAASVACRVSPLATAGRDFESYDASRITSSVPWVGTFPAGTAIGPSDHFLFNGSRFEVIASGSERTWELNVRVICRLVT